MARGGSMGRRARGAVAWEYVPLTDTRAWYRVFEVFDADGRRAWP